MAALMLQLRCNVRISSSVSSFMHSACMHWEAGLEMVHWSTELPLQSTSMQVVICKAFRTALIPLELLHSFFCRSATYHGDLRLLFINSDMICRCPGWAAVVQAGERLCHQGDLSAGDVRVL